MNKIQSAVRVVRDRLADIIGGPLRPEDRPLWRSATTIRDLADRMARWLSGEIRSWPGYYGPVDTDETDATGLTDALIRCNRAGYLTIGSQAGVDEKPTDNGRHWWTQLAAVEGFADDRTAARLAELVRDDGRFRILSDGEIAGAGIYAWQPCHDSVTVTWVNGSAYTRFGAHLDDDEIETMLFGGCSDAALDAVCWAAQVTIYDPLPGRNELWAFLAAAANTLQTHGE